MHKRFEVSFHEHIIYELACLGLESSLYKPILHKLHTEWLKAINIHNLIFDVLWRS